MPVLKDMMPTINTWTAQTAMGWLKVSSFSKLDHPDRYYVTPSGQVYFRRHGGPCIWSPASDPVCCLMLQKRCLAYAKAPVRMGVEPRGHYCTRFDTLTEFHETFELAVLGLAIEIFA